MVYEDKTCTKCMPFKAHVDRLIPDACLGSKQEVDWVDCCCFKTLADKIHYYLSRMNNRSVPSM